MGVVAVPAEIATRRRGTMMVLRQRGQPETWIGRLANEVYVGALVVGGVMAVAGVAAALIAFAMRVSQWVAMAD